MLGSLALGFAISFGLGSRDILKNIISGVYLSKAFNLNSEIKTNNINGKLKEVGTVVSTIIL